MVSDKVLEWSKLSFVIIHLHNVKCIYIYISRNTTWMYGLQCKMYLHTTLNFVQSLHRCWWTDKSTTYSGYPALNWIWTQHLQVCLHLLRNAGLHWLTNASAPWYQSTNKPTNVQLYSLSWNVTTENSDSSFGSPFQSHQLARMFMIDAPA